MHVNPTTWINQQDLPHCYVLAAILSILSFKLRVCVCVCAHTNAAWVKKGGGGVSLNDRSHLNLLQPKLWQIWNSAVYCLTHNNPRMSTVFPLACWYSFTLCYPLLVIAVYRLWQPSTFPFLFFFPHYILYHVPMSTNSNDISYHHNNKVEGEVVDSRPTGCVSVWFAKKKKSLQWSPSCDHSKCLSL